MNAPAPIIVLVPVPMGGSPKTCRMVRPPPYPAQPRDQRWPLTQTIPGGPSRAELQWEVQRALEHSKPQREVLLRRLAP
jgi:hypothetical protein